MRIEMQIHKDRFRFPGVGSYELKQKETGKEDNKLHDTISRVETEEKNHPESDC